MCLKNRLKISSKPAWVLVPGRSGELEALPCRFRLDARAQHSVSASRAEVGRSPLHRTAAYPLQL